MRVVQTPFKCRLVGRLAGIIAAPARAAVERRLLDDGALRYHGAVAAETGVLEVAARRAHLLGGQDGVDRRDARKIKIL